MVSRVSLCRFRLEVNNRNYVDFDHIKAIEASFGSVRVECKKT